MAKAAACRRGSARSGGVAAAAPAASGGGYHGPIMSACLHRPTVPSALPALLAVALLGGACSTSRLFAPREQQNGTAASGSPAALYPLGDQTGRRGELRLWSDGARRVEIDDREQTRLHVGFELENFTDQPLQLQPDAVHLSRLNVDGEMRAGDLAPLQVLGQTDAAPGQTARGDFWFDPGQDTMPRQIDGFDVHWRVQRQDGAEAWDQATPFQPFVRAPDPHMWWGWGWGYGFGYWGYPGHGWHCRH